MTRFARSCNSRKDSRSVIQFINYKRLTDGSVAGCAGSGSSIGRTSATGATGVEEAASWDQSGRFRALLAASVPDVNRAGLFRNLLTSPSEAREPRSTRTKKCAAKNLAWQQRERLQTFIPRVHSQHTVTASKPAIRTRFHLSSVYSMLYGLPYFNSAYG